MNKRHRLTDTRCKNTKAGPKEQKLTDGGGLYLLITSTGSRLWRYRYELGGKENTYALGEYCQAPSGETEESKTRRLSANRFTLVEARAKLLEAKQLVKAGIHPVADRNEKKKLAARTRATTFEGVAREWLERVGSKWKRPTYRQRERLLECDIFPEIGMYPIAELKRLDLNEVILKIESRAPQMAVLARQIFQQIFDHAESTGAVSESIALRLMKVERPKVEHARQLTADQIGPFLKACEGYAGQFETREAMKLAWLTLARTMEVLGAMWSEIDLDQGIWRIPAERMKMDRDHIIPLSKQAKELLTALKGVTGKHAYLFPNRSDKERPASCGLLWKMVDSIGWRDRFSPHGLRGTASTIMNESGRWSPDVIERLLAHAEENKVRASYNAAEYLKQRAGALQWWADFLDAKRENKKGAEIHHLPSVNNATKRKRK